MILFTLDMIIKKQLKKTAVIYAVFTVFIAVFGLVYEHFSHDVWSSYMGLCFLIPLFGGIFYIVLKRFIFNSKKNTASKLFGIGDDMYHSAVATFTLGSLIRGIVDIYGTTNHLLIWYAVAGCILLTAGVVLVLLRK